MTKGDFNLKVMSIIDTTPLSDLMGELVDLCSEIGIDFEDFTENLDANVRRHLGSTLLSVGAIKQPEGYMQPELDIF